MNKRFTITLVLIVLTILFIFIPAEEINITSNTKMYSLIVSTIIIFYNIYKLENE